MNKNIDRIFFNTRNIRFGGAERSDLVYILKNEYVVFSMYINTPSRQNVILYVDFFWDFFHM